MKFSTTDLLKRMGEYKGKREEKGANEPERTQIPGETGEKRAEEAVKKPEGKKNRMLVLKKKQIVAVSLLILIGIAGYLNWTFRNDAVDPDVAVMYNEASKKLGEAQMVSGDDSDIAEEAESASPSPEAAKGQNNYFAQAKLDRETKRSESMEMLTQLINAEGTEKEAKREAEEQIRQIAEYTDKETAMENLIRAKGFGETIVFVSGGMVSVAVESAGLNEIDAAQIQDIVTANTGFEADKIKIVEIKPGR